MFKYQEKKSSLFKHGSSKFIYTRIVTHKLYRLCIKFKLKQLLLRYTYTYIILLLLTDPIFHCVL